MSQKNNPESPSPEIPDSITKTIFLRAPVSRVWRALTDHEEFGEWFRVKLEAPFAEGKEARGQILHPGYEHLTWRAVVKKIEPETTFAFTWHPYGIDKSQDYSKETPTLVEFRLKEEIGGTRLTLTESGFSKVPEHRRAIAFRMNEQGWTIQVMENIPKYVAENP